MNWLNSFQVTSVDAADEIESWRWKFGDDSFLVLERSLGWKTLPVLDS